MRGKVKGLGGKAGRRIPSELLKDMREVYKNPMTRGGTPGQEALRALLRDDPKQFMAQLGALEKAHRQGVVLGGGHGRKEEEKAVNGGRVLDLIERLLREWENEKEAESG